MLAKIFSVAVVGLNALPITVEVDIASQGLPSFTIVGLPDKAVEESKERVRSALKNSGAEFPAKRITVNLAPADIPKIGPAYDLPIAVGILVASGQLVFPDTTPSVFVGELSLDGSVRHANGILPIVMFARDLGTPDVYVPSADAIEAAVVHGISVYPVITLISLFHHLSGSSRIIPQHPIPFSRVETQSEFEFDMADVHGQEHVKRALEIAAAGAHNVFLHGPPGSGKTMLARTMPSILPVMTEEEALEVTKIYSVTGNLPAGHAIMNHRPFRSPHHTTSRIGLIGGGTHPAPGEISLAHRGILFLDEFPEFPRNVLEALRQPVEDGIVTISRAAGTVTFPSQFMLIAAANPCPCGNYRSETRKCTCMPGAIQRYQRRISGPLLDRIDLHVFVPSVAVEKYSESDGRETSKQIRRRVQQARNRQNHRFTRDHIPANSQMTTRMIKEHKLLSEEAGAFLRQAVGRLALSARSYYRMIKVARTIADLSDAGAISVEHLAEALQYRPTEEGFL